MNENNITTESNATAETSVTEVKESKLPSGPKRVVVDPITRIEGHLRA